MARRREMIQKRVIAGDDLARHKKEPAMACIKIVIRSAAPLGMMLIALPAMAATAPDLSANDKVVHCVMREATSARPNRRILGLGQNNARVY